MGVPFLEEDNPQSPVPASPDMGGWSPVVPNAPQSTPPPPGRFKRMLMGGLSAAAEAGLNYAGVMTDEQKDALRAQTRQRLADAAESQARTNVMNSGMEMEDTPLGPMPRSTWSKLGPAYVTGQARIGAADKTAQAKEWAQKLNTTMQGLKLGYQVDVDDDGNLKFGAIPKENLSVPAQAAASGKAPNKIALTIAAQQGDKEAAKTLATLHQMDKDLVYARGDAFGRGRLWSLQRVYDPETGQTTLMPGFDVIKAQNSGRVLIPAGGMSQKEIISAQQLQSEATPAITDVRKTIKAYDNPNDRAIFARIMEGAGKPAYGQEAGWMGSILNQALKENLSPEGKHQAQALARLAETMGRLRSTLGLPATDQSMAITMALLPGKSTPNSKYAGEQVDQIEQMLNQAVGIPAYGGKPRPMTGNGSGKKDPLGIR